MKVSKKICASLPGHDICMGFKYGELGWHCFIWITCRNSHADIVERHCASRWICRSVRQQSVAVLQLKFGSRN